VDAASTIADNKTQHSIKTIYFPTHVAISINSMSYVVAISIHYPLNPTAWFNIKKNSVFDENKNNIKGTILCLPRSICLKVEPIERPSIKGEE
jgi:hypothetical protein